MDGWREGQADTGTHYTNSSITASKMEEEEYRRKKRRGVEAGRHGTGGEGAGGRQAGR